MISTKSDTSDEDQHVEENPKDGKVRNDEENLNNEEIPNVEENPTIEENSLGAEAESKKINIDTFVAEILAKVQEESSAGSSNEKNDGKKECTIVVSPQDHLPKWFHLLSSGDHQESEVKSLLIQIMNLK